MQGVGPENNHNAGPDYDAQVPGLVYRFVLGRQSPTEEHDPSPYVNRAAWSAIITAGFEGDAELSDHLEANHPMLSAWWEQRTEQQRGRLRIALMAGRGL